MRWSLLLEWEEFGLQQKKSGEHFPSCNFARHHEVKLGGF